MKTLTASLLLCALAFAAPSRGGDTPGSNDVLVFANKDVLHGSFLGCDKSTARWASPAATAPIVFHNSALLQAQFGPRKMPADAARATQMVRLANGDEFPGVVVSLDDKTLVVDTWYAGRLNFARRIVASVESRQAPGILYQGPSGIKEWKVTSDDNDKPGWAVSDGVLVSNNGGSIRRDMKLPAKSKIEFDVAVQNGSGVTAAIYAAAPADPDEDLSDCYVIGIGSDSIDFQRNANNNVQNLPNGDEGVPVNPAMFKDGWLHVEIRVDKDRKSLWLFLDGKMAKQWTDTDFAGKGTYMGFSNEDSTPVKVRNIRLSTWDGKIEDPKHAGVAVKEDSILMENKDQVSGALKSIAGGKIIITSAYADLTIALEHIDRIDFAGGGDAKPEKSAGDVRACFTGGGSARMQIDSWDEKQATATSPDFGKAVFSTAVFESLDFQPDRPPPPESAVPANDDAQAGDAEQGVEIQSDPAKGEPARPTQP
ncbi:MAG TPA: family 16 glycoside hydrolase [Chthoniobacteraceae bacterium]|nr:family 16 glycoside hydrolase [Chthoniobacteraceae bacterium]